jgi:hypothetical protein
VKSVFSILCYELRHYTVSYVITNILEAVATSILGVEVTLKIEALRPFETLIATYQTAQRHNLKVYNLRSLPF